MVCFWVKKGQIGISNLRQTDPCQFINQMRTVWGGYVNPNRELEIIRVRAIGQNENFGHEKKLYWNPFGVVLIDPDEFNLVISVRENGSLGV